MIFLLCLKKTRVIKNEKDNLILEKKLEKKFSDTNLSVLKDEWERIKLYELQRN